MNSQILKLARKSGATVNEGFDGTKNFVYGIAMSPEELDKFAQLIVEECRNVVTELYRKSPLEVCGYLIAADEEIAKHFYGVEE